jgi:hypothetical protein
VSARRVLVRTNIIEGHDGETAYVFVHLSDVVLKSIESKRNTYKVCLAAEPQAASIAFWTADAAFFNSANPSRLSKSRQEDLDALGFTILPDKFKLRSKDLSEVTGVRINLDDKCVWWTAHCKITGAYYESEPLPYDFLFRKEKK